MRLRALIVAGLALAALTGCAPSTEAAEHECMVEHVNAMNALQPERDAAELIEPAVAACDDELELDRVRFLETYGD
jgi:hypothetical protein